MRNIAIAVFVEMLAFLVSSNVAAADESKEKVQEEVFVDVDADKATHEEIKPLKIKFKRLTSLRLSPDGNLLVCDGGKKLIRVVNPKGKKVNRFKLPFQPEAIDVAADGTIYCGGEGTLVKLDAQGKRLQKVEAPSDVPSEGLPDHGKYLRKIRVSGIAVTGDDVFVAFGSAWSRRSLSKIFRFDRDLQNPKLIAEGLRGCCQRCDIATDGRVLYVAENTRYRILKLDREGNELGSWGSRSRTGLEGFGACCNPMNVCLGPEGAIYTAESGLGRIKRYTAGGKLLDLVGYVGVTRFTRAGHLAAACSNIAVDATPDGQRVFVMDYTNNLVRVLQKK